MKSKHRLQQEDDEKAGICYHNFPAFQGLYFLIVLQAYAMEQRKTLNKLQGKRIPPFFSELVWALQTHGLLEDNSLYRVTYQAETGALRLCGRSTLAWKNRAGGHNKVESTSVDGYSLSA